MTSLVEMIFSAEEDHEEIRIGRPRNGMGTVQVMVNIQTP